MVAPSRYRTPPTYKIRQRDGRYLADPDSAPIRWTSREPVALAFRTRQEALDFIERRFGTLAARELLGLRVV